ncbi:hypothetical protein NCC78_14315 [Micromonospora phytophila]|uniref:hypothetical protein n=1 Tax=Micromonospora phytophila TaxID=709888 RepID=UPI00202FB9B9|nr:hypothetical protein [Micromonospora phytophila]MCM0675853.1 hypothetical protein [Micromonospora phytophila]
MTSPDDSAALARIGEKLALLRRLEAERGFGVVIEEPAPLEPLADLPGVAEVYSLFRLVRGDNFRFAPPPEILTPQAWSAATVDPDDPMGSPLTVGHEVRSVPPGLRGDITGGDPIYLDREDLQVYWMAPDDYVFQYEHPDSDVEFTVIAADLATFFDEHVFGPGYPELVATVLGPGVRDQRLRTGRHAGEYADNWRRLLIAAGLAS